MTRPRGRPAQGQGVARDDILTTALTLLDESGGQGLTMRALATRLGVTPMSLYNHVADQAGLLRALSDRVYAEALKGPGELADHRAEIRGLLTRYHQAVGRHPQLTLALFATPEALAGVTRQITDRLTTLLAGITAEPILWRDVLVDHAHGSGLALASVRGAKMQSQILQEQYGQALDRLLDGLSRS
ncbi:TetR/AcrR family transcriptional regulator [Stenotrophomonas sp. ISL-67]|uniref:TetR/AcrR family transcriptional regulator n=1 Tax=Stenotrophomonas sp. ISL-67 TaxID=2819171 RepID=UPI001BED1EC4|nr:TetR/AcrR family transcriptional regulator [Stenotrophomonas sp. ISL-67]MBT2768283.1 TetR/AcrR family transcriptional regulator [Stenotrophomonas sp. ISL-67]